MRKLIASLSLVLTTGINALTSDNLVQDPYVEFLDSTYDYPNIHNHGTWQQDPYIYTGNINYEHSAVAEYDINLDTLKFEITQANYGYTYKSYSTGEGAIAIALIDADGNMIDDAVHEFDITTVNEWIDVDKIYNNMDNLSQAKELWLGVGGISDSGGTDDIMITDIYLTYEYQEIPLDIITDTSISLAFDDSVYTKLPEVSYDFPAEMPSTPEPEVTQPTQTQAPAPTPTLTLVAAPTPTPVSTPTTTLKSTPKPVAKTTTAKTTTKKESKSASKTETRKESRSEGVAQAIETTSLVATAVGVNNFSNPAEFFSNTGMDFESYTGVDLVELIELEEAAFYDEPDFYEQEIALNDNIQLNNIDFYKENNWYGSNTKFY